MLNLSRKCLFLITECSFVFLLPGHDCRDFLNGSINALSRAGNLNFSGLADSRDTNFDAVLGRQTLDIFSARSKQLSERFLSDFRDRNSLVTGKLDKDGFKRLLSSIDGLSFTADVYAILTGMREEFTSFVSSGDCSESETIR